MKSYCSEISKQNPGVKILLKTIKSEYEPCLADSARDLRSV